MPVHFPAPPLPVATEIAELREQFRKVASEGPPGLRGFASWLSDQPQELAFHSVRGLAEVAGVDANTVVRAVKAAGFSGYSEARRATQHAMRRGETGFSDRASSLRRIGSATLVESLSEAAQANLRRAFAPNLLASLVDLVPALLAARRVHCVGVRSAYSIAHLFSYRASIAHANIQPTPAQPGLIIDSLVGTGPEDVVILITFAPYSAEVIRAAKVARARGARIVAMTDRRDCPIATDVWRVLLTPIEGPNVMYSIAGAILIVETLLEFMCASDPEASGRIERFENGMLEFGTYLRA